MAGIAKKGYSTLCFLPPATRLGQGNILSSVSRILSTGKSTWAGTSCPGARPRQVHPLGRNTPPCRYPPEQVHPHAGTPPGQVSPWAGTLLGRYTPLDRYTPWAGTPPREGNPLGRYPPLMVNKQEVRILLECILVLPANSSAIAKRSDPVMVP